MNINVTKSREKEPFSSAVASNGETLKHLQVREAITLAIRSGEFPSGSRLPGERELARRFGASHMTARRAVTEMIEADLLERRTHQGTFVRSHGPPSDFNGDGQSHLSATPFQPLGAVFAVQH